MSFRSSSLLLLFACAPYLPMAQGTESVEHAAPAYELERHTSIAAGLERDLLARIATASSEERLGLYQTYNQLVGAWLQIGFLQSLLDFSVAATTQSDEEEIAAALRDQAEFTLGEFDHTIIDLEQNAGAATLPYQSRINEVLRSLFSDVRATVHRLLIDQCARAPCEAGP